MNYESYFRYNSENFLPVGLCPGPKQPKDLDSFLIPFLEELEILRVGVPAYDAHTKSFFLLKAHLVLLTGDTPGISKLLHMSGHVAKRPCRACKIEGTPYKTPYVIKRGRRKGQSGESTNHYYPLFPPTNTDAARRQQHPSLQSYQAKIMSLPRRTTEEYIRDGEVSSNFPDRAIESGIKGISPFACLETIAVPESAPFDLMHLVYLGLVRVLCALISGSFFKSQDLNEHAGRMTEADWVRLGVDMSNIRAPTSWGRYPRNIEKYISLFKAEELSNALSHYLLALSVDRVNRQTYKALQSLVLAVSIATSYQVKYTEIEEIERHIMLFVKWYYDTFYQGQSERLPACKYTVHGLLHLAEDLRNWGSASLYWQYAQVWHSLSWVPANCNRSGSVEFSSTMSRATFMALRI